MQKKIWISVILLTLFGLEACVEDKKVKDSEINDTDSFTLSPEDTLSTDSTKYYGGYNSEISTLFDKSEFPEAYMEQLLSEIKICNPQIETIQADGVAPCSPELFSIL